MKRFVTTLAAAMVVAACFDDPTSDLRGGASQIRLTRSQVFLNPGLTTEVEATLLDRQGNTVPGILTFSSANAAIATAADTDTLEGLVQSTGVITGVAAGQTYVRVTGSGVTDSIRVVVVPVSFTGSIAPATGNVGTEMTATAPPGLTFDTARVAVSVDGGPGWITAKSASSVSFIAPSTTTGAVRLTGLVLLGTIALPALPATTTITVTEPSEPANDAPGGGALITLPATVGASVTAWGVLNGCGSDTRATPTGCGGNANTGDIDDFFRFTATRGDSIAVAIQWANDDVDIDGYVLNSTGSNFCVLDGCAAAGASNPEVARVRLVAGISYTVLVDLFNIHGQAAPLPYRVTITRIQ